MKKPFRQPQRIVGKCGCSRLNFSPTYESSIQFPVVHFQARACKKKSRSTVSTANKSPALSALICFKRFFHSAPGYKKKGKTSRTIPFAGRISTISANESEQRKSCLREYVLES